MEKKIVINDTTIFYDTFTAVEIAEYKSLRDMYYGTGGFLDGSYLEQFPRESDDFFTKRKKLAHYENVFQPELDALTNPIFSKDQVRDEINIVVDKFVQRPTKLNESMKEYQRRKRIEANLYGVVWEICDSSRNTPLTGAGDGSPDLMPYTYYLNPLQIDGYSFDDSGALECLVYYVDKNRQNNELEYTTNNEDTLQVWVNDGVPYTFQYSNGKVIEGSFFTFDTFPVLMIETNTRYKSNKVCKSTYIDQAGVCKNIYNLTSWFNDSFFKNCFAFLAVNGTVPEDFDLGNDGVYMYQGEGLNAPLYVAPPVEHLKVMIEEVGRLILGLKDNMNASLPSGTNESGESRIQKDKRRIERLKIDAQDVQDNEIWLVNKALKNYIADVYDYSVIYIKDFESLTKGDELDSLQRLLDTGYLKSNVTDEVVSDMIRISYSNKAERAELLAKMQIETIEQTQNDSFDNI